MNWAILEEHLLELIRRTSTDLPGDVERVLRRQRRREQPASAARWAMDMVLENIRLARQHAAPLCQDTGTLLFYCRLPVNVDPARFEKAARRAVTDATRLGILRENTVETLTGRSCSSNVGAGLPVFHFEAGNDSFLDIRLIMKGGGSENAGSQYSLPEARLKAGRDLDGVRRCVLDALVKIQGSGCAPGVLGVCVGGDRATGMEFAKRQFLRELDDASALPVLAKLERRLFREGQALRIGPMGFGGASTLLGVKLGTLCRLPASYFVSISYMCWAMRRRGIVLAPQGGIRKWLYGD
ncbi:MAG: fumarate hydratase [Lentisphaerae bacterium]|nr:fumarate hydratase [Lentisphaerota bacterium]